MLEGTEIREVESGDPLNWGDIFFALHKHCHLNKWEIWEYTLPQVAELMKLCNQYVQFEIETRLHPFGLVQGTASPADARPAAANSDGSYEEMTEEDLNLLARALGGA